MKNRSLLKILSGILVAGLMVSCMGMEEGNPSSLKVPEVKSFEVKDNGSLVFELTASIDKSLAGRIAECGFYYGKEKSMSGAEKVECKMLGGSFFAEITLCEYGETFYACSYISNGVEGNEICSDPKSITVKELQDYVEFGQAALVSYDRATKAASVSVSYEVEKGVDVTAIGLCYGTSSELSVNGSTLNDKNLSSGSVTYEIPGVEAGKTYYVRPYLYDGDDLAYGQVQELHAYAVPVVEIRDVSEIKSDSASVSCEVVDDCGKAIQSRGVVYVKGDGEPTLSTGKSAVSGTTGEYTVTLSGLSPNTLYSVRAYAENEKGVAYSAEKRTFTTSVALPSVTVSIGNKTSSSANVTGNITSDGGEAPSEVGFYYSMSEEVDPATATKVAGKVSGSSFTAELDGLTRVTKYYVRAYAVNSAGEALSSSVSFTTQAELPVVETLSVTDITYLGAKCGGNVLDDGGSAITAKGVVWSVSQNPTVSLSTKTNEGKEIGEFSAMMAGLTHSTKYNVRAYATNSAGTSYGVLKEFETIKLTISNVPDLSLKGTANCYIVSRTGINRFRTVKGNSYLSIGSVNSVEVLWESFGTSTAPNVGDLIKSACYSDGYVLFETASSFREGNALIAAKDAAGKILWSWHIWLTDEPGKCVYANNAGTMMDRNLGATSATPGDVGALGLLYQWGRKDPFLGSSSISSSRVKANSTISWPSAVSSYLSRATIAYATEHPTTYIDYNTYNYDWYYSGSSSTDNTRWQSKKTIYDPCPAGWRVPDGGSNGVWSKALGSSSSFYYTYDSTKEGMNFSGKFGADQTIWYPASGYRDGYDGSMRDVGIYGCYWSVTPGGVGAYGLRFHYNGSVDTTDYYIRTNCYSVRCLQE